MRVKCSCCGNSLTCDTHGAGEGADLIASSPLPSRPDIGIGLTLESAQELVATLVYAFGPAVLTR